MMLTSLQADIDTNRLQMAEYMNCGTEDERSDFFAFNDYSWCDPSSFTVSGWNQKVKNFTGYGIPLFLSEYGCNTNQRQFQEVSALYSTKMTGVYSGGLVYEYSEQSSNYGLVEIDGNNVKELPDYNALKTAFANTPSAQGDGGYNSTGGANACPTASPPNWDVTGDALPAMPDPAKKFLTKGAGKGQGFSGPGSMDAGTQSTGTATPGSGRVTDSASSSSSTTSKGAAGALQPPRLSLAPIAVCAATVLGMLFGAGLILM